MPVEILTEPAFFRKSDAKPFGASRAGIVASCPTNTPPPPCNSGGNCNEFTRIGGQRVVVKGSKV